MDAGGKLDVHNTFREASCVQRMILNICAQSSVNLWNQFLSPKFTKLNIAVNNPDVNVRWNNFLEDCTLSMASRISYPLGSNY